MKSVPKYAAFFDASGNATLDRCMFVTGLVARAETWAEFGDDWAELLRRHELGDSLHMTDWMGCYRQYAAWKGDSARQIEVHAAVRNVVAKHSLACVGAGLLTSDLARLRDEYDLSKVGFGFDKTANDGYSFCATSALMSAMEWRDASIREEATLSYYFEFGDNFQRDFQSAAWDNFGLATMTLEKSNASAFQLADYLAWLHRDRLRAVHSPLVLPVSTPLALMNRVLRGSDKYVRFTDRHMLRNLARQLGFHPKAG